MFQLNTGVVVVAATNRPDMLDDALLRPGRFDKLLYVPPPNAVGRLDILRVITARMPLSNCVDLEAVAHHTEFFSGADLSNLCREVSINSCFEPSLNKLKMTYELIWHLCLILKNFVYCKIGGHQTHDLILQIQ